VDFTFPLSPKAFNIMLKPVGPVCNLDCTYCYYLEKKNLYPDNTLFRLSDELLEKFIREYIESQQVPVVTFVWQGGEPSILGVDYYRKAVELQKKYANGKTIENSFQTNGTFLTEEFCQFFKENNFLLGISIDGPQHLHDHYRKDNQGRPTWAKVMKGIEMLRKHGVEFNTLSVVNRKTSKEPLAVYNFLKDIGSTFMQFIPIVERKATITPDDGITLVPHSYTGEARVTEWSVLPEDYGQFLITIFNQWVRTDVGRYYVQMFDVTLANWAGAMPGLCVFSESCGTAAVMEHNGDVFCCDHYVYDDYFLGNMHDTPLNEMMGSTRQALFGQEKKTRLTAHCRSCSVRFACHGDCPKHRFTSSPQGEPGLSYLCESYKMFFTHVKPYMDFMTTELKAQRPPANVMHWIRRREEQQQAPKQVKTGRNDPCPCGSGRKYKQCHALRG
jgi:uncharacterized protein